MKFLAGPTALCFEIVSQVYSKTQKSRYGTKTLESLEPEELVAKYTGKTSMERARRADAIWSLSADAGGSMHNNANVWLQNDICCHFDFWHLYNDSGAFEVSFHQIL